MAKIGSDIRLIDYDQLDEAERHALTLREEDDLSAYMQAVQPILDDIRTRGDAALIDYERKFDVTDSPEWCDLAVSKQEFEAAFDQLSPDLIDVLGDAADNIRAFHQLQMPKSLWINEMRPGVFAGERTTPLKTVALYSPRGKGSFPSVALMTAIPAVVAGVPRPIMLTPPDATGQADPATLVAAKLAGVEEVYKLGGAQAVGAVAYGTQTIPHCLKIEGPGSPYFMAAKQCVHRLIDTGLPAGPSEVIIFATPEISPELAALDLMIESEHGADSSAYLVTTDATYAAKVKAALPKLMEHLSDMRAGYIDQVLSGAFGGIVIAKDEAQAFDFINLYAPEHLQILANHPMDYLDLVENAAEILLGSNTPGSIANYMIGPNCVLPTSGAAKWRSALSVHDFLKTTSIGHLTRQGFQELAPKTHKFASYEGFDAHALAVSQLREKLR